AVCLKCLEKDPGRRYGSAAALAGDLRGFLDGRPTAARPLGPLKRAARRVRRHPVTTALAVASLVAGVSLALLTARLAGANSDLDAINRELGAERDRALEREGRLRREAYPAQIRLAAQLLGAND